MSDRGDRQSFRSRVPGGPHPAIELQPLSYIASAGAVSLVAALSLAFQGLATAGAVLVVLSLAHVAFGTWVFVVHGGRVMTFTGLYFLASAMFVGVAGLYTLSLYPEEHTPSLWLASLATLLANLLLYLVRFAKPIRMGHRTQLRLPVKTDLARHAVLLGSSLVATAIGAGALAGASLGPIPPALGFLGVAALFAGVVMSRTPGTRALAVLAAMAGFLIYLFLFFEGFGRLDVVGLCLTGFVFLNVIRPHKWQKRGLLIAVVPALIAAGIVGATRGDGGSLSTAPRASQVLFDAEGLISGVEPLFLFSQLIELDLSESSDSFPRQNGATFLEAVPASFPREWWPDKPLGFGKRLADFFVPELTDTGYSVAALAFGEWYANFGWLAFLLIPVPLALVFRWSDRGLFRVASQPLLTPRHFVRLMMIAVLLVGITDFVWVGLFTYMSRSVLRALLLLPILIWTARIERIRGQLRPSDRPRRRSRNTSAASEGGLN
jgi:hypothetical protein